MNVTERKHTKISIIGARRSGVAVASLLRSTGADIFVSDLQSKKGLQRELEELELLGVPFETDGHSERVYECSLMVISPGVPSYAPVVSKARERGIKVVSELEVASWFCPCPIIAITGSNGKTTTTTLVGRILGDAKKKHVVAGNIGTAFSSVVLELDQTSLAVLEVSSFQLDHCETFRPWISAILNITPDHMDRYGNVMERYAESKARIFMNQQQSDILIHSSDDEWTMRTVNSARPRKLGFSVREKLTDGAFLEGNRLVTIVEGKRTEIITIPEISIKGMHNVQNAMAATLIGQLAGVGVASIRATLRNFRGVEHRLEFVRELNGVRYFNDSKATNVDSVRYALQAFEQPIVILLGGRDKGNDYSQLMELVKENVRAVVAIGESADKVVAAFSSVTKTVKATSIDKAVQQASQLAQKGDVVLLSPACASFDWFADYEERGRVFKQFVHKL
jgi:UDP-N-acetylmuramoylalanine--D-glutamate ligase